MDGLTFAPCISQPSKPARIAFSAAVAYSPTYLFISSLVSGRGATFLAFICTFELEIYG